MSYKLYIDEFDSKIFEKNVYKFYISNLKDLTWWEDMFWNILSWSVIFWFVLFESKIISFMQENGFLLKSIRSVYKYVWNINEQVFLCIDDIQKIQNDISWDFSWESVQDLANIIGQTSRYYNDDHIKKNTAQSIYSSWIENVLKRQYGDWWFVIRKKNRILWIINLIIKNWDWYIDLLWVIPELQWKWYWKQLTIAWINFLIEKWVNNIYVTTEWENIWANRFYQKNNFILENLQLVYHKHIN